MSVIFTFYDSEFALNTIFQPFFSVYHLSQFSKSHSMRCCNRQIAYSRFVFHIENRPVRQESDGIRAVEEDKLLSCLRARLHHFSHCYIVGIETYSNVL